MKKVRVRFAPSPTGPLHIGGVRTALYNYLFAKKHGGDFILRIEDTDEKRFVPGAEDYIRQSLKWLGIEPTEDDTHPGDCGPYRQSDRKCYKEYADQLVASGKAYYAFDTDEELEAKRTEFASAKSVFKYDHITRNNMKNSLVLPEDKVKEMIDAGTPYVIRLKVPRNESVKFSDTIRGNVVVDTNTLDDKVLLKVNGVPTYHLANIVDDHLMDITHVIRGEEWLPSAPFHVLLYNALGWDAPEFVHLPLILGPSGKLSKRDGDKYGFPVYPLAWTDPETGEKSRGYREDGFLPEAVLNIVALLGWSPGDNKEFITLDDMVEKFDLKKVHKAGAKFDLTKAEWLNREHLRMASNERLARLLFSDFGWSEHTRSLDRIISAAGLLKERSPRLIDFWRDGSYLFEAPVEYKYFAEVMTPEMLNFISVAKEKFSDVPAFDYNHDGLKPKFDEAIAAVGIKPRDAGVALRGALCDNKVGPSIFDIMAFLGKDEVHERLCKHPIPA